MHISTKTALEKLEESKHLFFELFHHGTLNVEIYKPDEIDLQMPHERDEIYVIVSGTGKFINGDRTISFQPGDFLFVPAGMEHRFLNFTKDFSTWVFLYGQKGGEK